MAALAIVPNLNELEQSPARMIARLEASVAEQLLRQRGEEALDDSVVPAIADATHADGEPRRREQTLIGLARVLASAIGVMEAAPRPAMPERHAQRTQRKLLIE